MIQAFTHAIFVTALFADPFHAISPELTQKPIAVHSSASDLVSIEKHWYSAIKNYAMQHHQGWQTLNITLDYTSDQAIPPKLTALDQDINQFLSSYPNEDDFWEVINRELTQTILHAHPELSSIAITLEVLPTDRIPYTRASIVTQNRNGSSLEEWRFAARVPLQIRGDDLNYEVEYLYREGITNREYPDFVPISDRAVQLLMTAITKGEAWEAANQDIAERILQKYPVLDEFTSRLENRAKGGRQMTDRG